MWMVGKRGKGKGEGEESKAACCSAVLRRRMGERKGWSHAKCGQSERVSGIGCKIRYQTVYKCPGRGTKATHDESGEPGVLG